MKKNFRKSNTEVKVDKRGNAHLYLFGNRIAVKTVKALYPFDGHTSQDVLNRLKNL